MRRALITVVMIVLLAGGVSAGNLKPITLYAGTGLSVPGGPDGFKDSWKIGYHVFGGVGYNLMPCLQVIGHFGYHVFPYDIDKYVNSGTFPNSSVDEFDGRTYSVIMIGLDTRFSVTAPGARARPYVQLGFGIADTDVDDLNYNGLTVRQGAGETKPYLSFAGGVESALGPKLSLFFQGQMVLIFYDDDNSRIANKTVTFFPISIGLKF